MSMHFIDQFLFRPIKKPVGSFVIPKYRFCSVAAKFSAHYRRITRPISYPIVRASPSCTGRMVRAVSLVPLNDRITLGSQLWLRSHARG
eukprot:scaffold326371_cov13-Prasinocladus_malaysianus.AAC.1